MLILINWNRFYEKLVETCLRCLLSVEDIEGYTDCSSVVKQFEE